MLTVIPLKCASCGSRLEITPEMENFSCGYCGVSQTVERRGGTISLRLVSEAIKLVQTGTDKTAAELALKRLANDLVFVDQSYHNARARKSRSLDGNMKLWGGLWLGSILFCFVVAAQSRTAAVFAFVLGLVSTVGLIYLAYKRDAHIRLEFEQIEKEILKQGNDIQQKINRNRQLVDS